MKTFGITTDYAELRGIAKNCERCSAGQDEERPYPEVMG